MKSMYRQLSALLVALLTTAGLLGADILGSTEVAPQHTAKLSIKSVPTKGSAIWKVKPLDGQKASEIEWISDKRGKEIRWIGPLGRYEVTVTVAAIDKDGVLDLDYGETVITFGEPQPPPPGPNPPGPNPPGPNPVVPIPGEGLRVLMVYESSQTLDANQDAVLYGKAVREYLNSKCPAGPDGKTKEWRIYDKDVDTTGESATWQNAMKRERKEVPWIIISNGKQGYEGPLPKNPDEALTLLKKYGG